LDRSDPSLRAGYFVFILSYLVELLMRFPALISFFLLCCGLASGSSEDIGRKVVATVLSVHGLVIFGIDEQTDFRPITPAYKVGNNSNENLR